MMHPLSREYVIQRLRVNLATGRCVWRDATKHHRPLVGKEAGGKWTSENGTPYWLIRIDGNPYRRGYLIYLVKHGRWPEPLLDHKNGNSLDDRASNLRCATRLQNSQNRKTGKPGRKLPMGVRDNHGKFQPRITIRGKQVCLGGFDTAREAELVYKRARRAHFGEWA